MALGSSRNIMGRGYLLLLKALLFFSFTSCSSLVDPRCLGDVSYTPHESWDALASPSFYSQKSSACYPPCGKVPSLNSCCLPEEYQCPDHPLANWELIDIALSNNPQTKISWEQARSAYFVLGQAKSSLYPTINYTETFSYTDTTGGSGSNLNNQTNRNARGTSGIGGGGSGLNSGAGGSGGSKNGSSSNYRSLIEDLSISYLLFDFGGRSAQIESAKQALFAANWMQNRTLQDVMIQVLQNYYGYLGSNALLQARYEDLINAKQSLEAAEAQHEAGLNTRVDVLLALSNVMQVELAIQNQIGQSKIDRGRLANSMGLGADSCFDLVPLPDKLPIDEVKQDMCKLVSTAQFYRDDLAAAFANYQQKKADYVAVRSQGLPRVDLLADLKRFHIWRTGDNFEGHDYAAGIALSFPIFQGFYYYNRERQARAEIDIACANLQQTLSNLLLDVVTSYYQFETATETVKYSEAYLVYSKEAYELSLANYKMGVGTILNVLQAQADLSNARAQYAQARTQWVTSLANIAYATGTL